MSPPYKDKRGRFRTQSLFKEYPVEGYEPVFTLKEFNNDPVKDNLPSFRELFLSYNDPTGYQFAKEVLGSYEHWIRLVGQQWFMNYLEGWLEELEVKLASEGLKRVRDIASGETAQSLAANKFLVNKGWEATKGRPKKEDVKRAVRVRAKVEKEVEGDLNRIKQ